MELLKLCAVFAVIIVALRFKCKLYQAMLLAIIATALLWRLPLVTCGALLVEGLFSVETLTLVAILYAITFLQRLLERRQQLRRAQQDLAAIFNNRRINATLAPVFIGLLPSAAAATICGEIVNEACGDDLPVEERAFVTTYFRHIPESFLPTYSSVILMSGLSGVPLGSFVVGMLPLVAVLFLLGYLFYIRKLPRDTGLPPQGHKGRSALQLLGHLWTLAAIIVLILAFRVPTIWAVLAVAVLAYPVYRFPLRELPPLLQAGFEPVLISNTFLVMVFKAFLTETQVISTLPETLSKLPIPAFLVFALIFFLGALVSGSSAIIASCTAMAFAAIPGGGMPLMVLLMSFCYAAMQVSPTHVCLAIVIGYFKVDMGALVKKTLPVIGCFCVVAVGYYLLLTALL